MNIEYTATDFKVSVSYFDFGTSVDEYMKTIAYWNVRAIPLSENALM